MSEKKLSGHSMHVYEVRQRKDHRGVDLISDALPFGRLWYEQVTDAIVTQSIAVGHIAVWIRIYYGAGNVIETHEQAGKFKEL